MKLITIMALLLSVLNAQTRITPRDIRVDRVCDPLSNQIVAVISDKLVCLTLGPAVQIIQNGNVFMVDVPGQHYQIVDAETPSGVVDGTNAVFTLAHAPSPAASLQLFRNGLLMRATVDYALSGQTITFAAGSIPQMGDSLIAQQYRY